MLRSRVKTLEKRNEYLEQECRHLSLRILDREKEIYALLNYLGLKIRIIPATCPKLEVVPIKKIQKYSRAKELMTKIHKKCKRQDCDCKGECSCDYCK